jgi:hypothetical protein
MPYRNRNKNNFGIDYWQKLRSVKQKVAKSDIKSQYGERVALLSQRLLRG